MRAVSHAYRDADDIRAELPLFFSYTRIQWSERRWYPNHVQNVAEEHPCNDPSVPAIPHIILKHARPQLGSIGRGNGPTQTLQNVCKRLGLEFYRDSCEQFSEKDPTTSTAVFILNLRAATASNNFTPILFDRASPWPPHHVASSMLSHQLTIP